ncbi:MAG: hypothetical protein GXO67_08250 [Archaeoglobi archaeon]|nr:hypothetical protein [Archaeoglobi archaeon]
MDGRDDNVTFTYSGRIVKWQTLERAKDYETVVVFVEMEGVEHAGYLMRKGNVVIAKGEVAKAVRDAGIEGVEMAVAPPLDTNALIMLRVNRPVKDVIEDVVDIAFGFLRERGFI